MLANVHQQGRQRGGRDRPGYQRLGRLLDHGAQVRDAAAGPTTVLRDGNAEQSQIRQAAEYRPPRVGLPLLDAACGFARARASGPVAHQFTRRELFVGDDRYHVLSPPGP
jgi:hypothetical protein